MPLIVGMSIRGSLTDQVEVILEQTVNMLGRLGSAWTIDFLSEFCFHRWLGDTSSITCGQNPPGVTQTHISNSNLRLIPDLDWNRYTTFFQWTDFKFFFCWLSTPHNTHTWPLATLPKSHPKNWSSNGAQAFGCTLHGICCSFSKVLGKNLRYSTCWQVGGNTLRCSGGLLDTDTFNADITWNGGHAQFLLIWFATIVCWLRPNRRTEEGRGQGLAQYWPDDQCHSEWKIKKVVRSFVVRKLSSW